MIQISVALALLLLATQATLGATLSGYVYDRYTDKPLPGVRVVIGAGERETLSDSSGYFVFPDLAGGIYDLELSLEGYYTGFRKRVRVATGRHVEVEIALKSISQEHRSDEISAALKYGSLAGSVRKSQTSEALPGAVIRVLELGMGAQSDPDGNFAIPRVKPGRHTVEVTLIGYKQIKNYAVEIFAGDETRLDFELEETVLPLGSEVIVYGERPLIDPTIPAAIRSIERQEIERGAVRDLGEVLKELPGVVEIDRELHIRGGRTYETLYMIDGVSVTDPLIRRGYGHSLHTGAISELNLYTGGADAEFAQATSGVVEIVTREGQEDLTGSVNYRNDHLFGDAGFNSDLLEMTLSGPEPLTSGVLRKSGLPGQTYFFWSGSFALSNTYLPYSTNLHSATMGGKRWAPRADNQYSTIFKLTWTITPMARLSASYSGAAQINQDRSILETRLRTIDYSYGYPFEYARILDRYNTFTQKSNQQIINFDWRLSLAKRLRLTAGRFFTTLRSQVADKSWSEYTQPVDNKPDTLIYDPDLGVFDVIKGDGFWDSGDGDTWYDHYIESSTLKSTYETEVQTNFKSKMGLEGELQTVQVLDIYRPWLGETGFGLNYDAYRAKPSTWGAFVQNNLNLEGLIFDFGFRYDLWFPGKVAEDALLDDSLSQLGQALRDKFFGETSEVFGRRARGTISPRFGISNLISTNLTLFGSYSRFARKPSPQYLYAKLYTPSQATYQLYGNPSLDYEKVTNIEAGVKYLPTERIALSISGYRKEISDYIAATAVAPDPRFPEETYFLYFNLDFATSQGVEVEYLHRVTDVWSLSANCAFSRARGERSLPADILRGLEARSEGQIYNDVAFDWDKPWQFVIKTNFFVPPDRKPTLLGMTLPSDWNLNLKFWGQSGKRYTPYRETTDDFGFTVFVPDGETNSKIGPWWNSFDVTFQKYFRWRNYTLTLFFEGINILDHKNVTLINPLTGKEYRAGDTVPSGGNLFELPPAGYQLPLWENPTRFLAPRQLKLGLGVSF